MELVVFTGSEIDGQEVVVIVEVAVLENGVVALAAEGIIIDYSSD